MTVRLAINGIGRTGPGLKRAAFGSSDDLVVVAVNDQGAREALAGYDNQSAHPAPLDGFAIVGAAARR